MSDEFAMYMITAKESGKAEGKAEGRAEGRAEGIKAVARALLREGMSHKEVSKATGLDTAVVKQLMASLVGKPPCTKKPAG